MRKLMLLTPIVVVGCAANAGPGSHPVGLDQVPPGAVCTQSGALDTFRGQIASAELGARMMGAAQARKLRWVGHGMAVTMDYNPNRLTVQLDEQSRVVSAKCG